MVEDNQIKAQISPFAIREGEIKTFDGKDGYVSMNQIVHKINIGHINEIHFAILDLVNEFEFITSRQLYQMLEIKGFDPKSQDKLNNKLEEINDINEDIDSQIKTQEALINYYKTICTSETQLLTSCTTVQASSGWLKPVTKGKINSRWGYRNQVLNTGTFHNAHDIGGNAEGTPAYAAAAGTVAAITRRSSCGGNMVYIHVNVLGKAYTMQYAHLLSIKVKVGDKVTTNTVIGLIGGGSTAKANGGYDRCTTGTHLHFGISKGYYLKDYTKWSKFIANSIEPPGYPKTGVWWYSR